LYSIDQISLKIRNDNKANLRILASFDD